MKKILLSLVALCTALVAGAQTEVVFDFDNNSTELFGIEGRSSGSNDTYVADGEFTEDGVATIDGVTVTVDASAEDASTKNRLWTSSPVLRLYNGNLTVSAPGKNITKIVFVGNSNFNIGSVSSGSLDGKTWVSSDAVSEVVFSITKNTQIKNMTVTLDGEIGEEPEPIVLDGTGEGTVESPYDVTRAVSICDNSVYTSEKVYIKGTIKEVSEISTDYGNATYTITDGTSDLIVYRGYSLEGKKFTSEDEIQDGDEVIVYGALTVYKGTNEVATGSSIYSLNGETSSGEEPEEPGETHEIVGDGSKENPYTVEDVIALNNPEDAPVVWVVGYIVGCVNTNNGTLATGDPVASNLALASTADGTTVIPVQLPAGDVRNALNIADNPDNKGKKVLLYGKLTKYCGTAGLKEVSDFVIEGSGDGVVTLQSAGNESRRVYDLTGRRVEGLQKGLDIVNGKKAVVK